MTYSPDQYIIWELEEQITDLELAAQNTEKDLQKAIESKERSRKLLQESIGYVNYLRNDRLVDRIIEELKGHRKWSLKDTLLNFFFPYDYPRRK